MEGHVTIAGESSRRRLRNELKVAVARLSAGGIDNPRLDAEVLLAYCLNMRRDQLIVAGDLPIAPAAACRYESLLQRRLSREPVAYLTGTREFWSLDFAVTSDVLIPRPDTERLVEVGLLWAARFPVAHPLRVADLGTGSGAVAVSLARELPCASICATDISPAALAVAERNAEAHHLATRMQFSTGDLFDALSRQPNLGYDLIVSNPPYVRRAEIVALAPEVGRWEPHAALDGGTDGLDFYRRIVATAPDYLAVQGALALEIAADMAKEVSALCRDSGCFRDIEIFQDYTGRDRVILAQVCKN